MKPAIDPARSQTTQAAMLLRQIPSIDELMSRPRLFELAKRTHRALVVEIARTVLVHMRALISSDPEAARAALEPDRLDERISSEVEHLLAPSLRAVINATGVILHTNLGRAPLSSAAVDRLRQTATQYSNLEYDLKTGARGKRDVHTARLLGHALGAESAVVVNNGAAAVFLVLNALAKGGEVIVSRGELIEIGDGFRVPEIMAESGAVLREVGTTNRTRLADYERAINANTRLLLRVHPSNFRITGFTERTSIEELSELGERTGLPVFEDLGSGCLVDLSVYGFDEPVARASLAAGVSLVSFSGDKLLGGPQAGIIAGKKELVQRVRRAPLFRALRVDKLTIAALEATLSAYLRGALDEIPALGMIGITAEEIERRSRLFADELRAQLPSKEVEIEVRPGQSLVGGGSTPTQHLPTSLLTVTSARYSAVQLEARLRAPAADGMPVLARIEEQRLVIDLRTVLPAQQPILAAALATSLR